MKILYFEGAGCVPRGEVENCRIRTAYKNKHGEMVYLEMIGVENSIYKFEKGRKEKQFLTPTCYIDFAFVTKIEEREGKIVWTDCNKNEYQKPKEQLNYTKAEILRVVNTYFDGDFDEIVILPNLAGYRVHTGKYNGKDCPYNLMDDFVYDEARTRQAEKIKQYFYDFEKNVLGKKYPNNSVYFENDVLKVVIHYNGFNDKLEIANVFDFKFDYEKPAGATVGK